MWTCSTHGGDDNFIQNLNRNLRGSFLFRDAEVHDRIILKVDNVEGCEGVDLIHWLRVETSGGLLLTRH
jgi:hypothetical protein